MSAGSPGPVEQLAPDIHAVALQQGEVVVLGPEGQPAAGLTRVPAGWYYTELGHHRLTVAVAQLQSDRAAAEASASAYRHALGARDGGDGGCAGAVLLLVGLLLFGLGVVVGRFVLPTRAASQSTRVD